ncbi:MAG: family efflux transporter permease subunit [Frondihabitans sp.]|nr:family efflux transporter permease subunit [Frondihabitans sp.]
MLKEPATGLPATASRTGASTRLAPGSSTIIIVILVATFVVVLNETIMSIALPTLIVELDISPSTAQWLTTGFALTLAVVIPTTGFLSDRFSTRTVFIVAMSLFSIGTATAAAAPSFPVLLIGRLVQALGTGMMIPLLSTSVLLLVPQGSRGRMMGYTGIVIAAAPAIGPPLSGLILDVLSWRFMFITVLPIALVTLGIGAFTLRSIGETRSASLDVPSVILAAIGLSTFVFGLSSLVSAGGAALDSLGALAVGLVSLTVFSIRQRRLARRGRALLNLRVFSSSTFTVATACFAMSSLVLFGSLAVLPIYLQDVLHLSTLATGLVLLPGGVTLGVLAPVVGRCYDRFGPSVLISCGAAIVSAALWLMWGLFSPTTGAALVIGLHVLLCAGLACLFTPLTTSALEHLPRRLYAHGNAVISTVQQVMAGAGTAILVGVLAASATAHESSGVPAVSATTSGVRAAVLVGALASLIPLGGSFVFYRLNDRQRYRPRRGSR